MVALPRPLGEHAHRPLGLTRGGLVGLVIVAGVIAVAILAPWIAPRPFAQQDLDRILLPPVGLDGSDSTHLLGTDQLGRDLLSRLMFGARTSLLVGAGAVLLAAAIGVPLGIVAGYTRGPLDDLIMRLVDLQLAFPPIFLAIAVMCVVGQNLGTVAVVLGIVSWPQYARVARGSTLVVARSDYVEAVIALGAGVPGSSRGTSCRTC
jgi:ABC-type dipeptide/oligopeptide/nickel transport system permease subunit